MPPPVTEAPWSFARKPITAAGHGGYGLRNGETPRTWKNEYPRESVPHRW